MLICVEDIFAGERVFEYFQDNDEKICRLRQFLDNDNLQAKSLGIFSGDL